MFDFKLYVLILHDWPARHIVDSQEESPEVVLGFSHGEFLCSYNVFTSVCKKKGAVCVGVPYTRRCYARGNPNHNAPPLLCRSLSME